MTLSRNKILAGLSFLALAFATLTMVPGIAAAETTVGVVDVQYLLTESLGAKSVQKQLEKQRESFQAEVAKYERELKDMEAAVVKARDAKNEAEFKTAKEAFEKKLADTKSLVTKRRDGLEKAAGAAMVDLRKEIVKITSTIADQKKMTMVVTKNNVILADKNLDITEDVMKKLNETMKEIKLKIETN